MPRYVKDLATNMSAQEAWDVVQNYMQSEGFTYKTEGTENVWMKGGAATIPQFLKAEPADGVIHLEAWVAKVSWVPGVYTGEQGLDGFWGWAIKAKLKERVVALEYALSAGAAAAAGQVPAAAAPAEASGATPAGWYPDPHGRHESRYWDGAAWTAGVSNQGVQSEDPV